MPFELMLEINVVKIYFHEDFLSSCELNPLSIIFQPFWPAKEIPSVLEKFIQDSLLAEE